MVKITLHRKVSQLLVTAIVTTTFAVSIFVWNHTNTSIRNQLTERLSLSYNMLVELFHETQIRLHQNAIAVSQNQLLVNAIKKEDFAGVDWLFSIGELQTDAVELRFFSSNGSLLHSTNPNVTDAVEKGSRYYPIEQAMKHGNFKTLKLINGKYLLCVYLSYAYTDDIRVIRVTYDVGETFLSDLKTKTFSDVTIISLHNKQHFMTTLSGNFKDIDDVDETSLIRAKGLPWKLDTVLGSPALYSKQFPSLLNNANESYLTYVTVDSDSVTSSFLKMQSLVLIFAFVTAVAAVLCVRYIFIQVLRPLEAFSQYSDQIANGDYSQSIKTQSSFAEILRVQEDLNAMVEKVKTREESIIESTYTDPLTGLYTRGHIKSILQSELINVKEFQAVVINVYGFRGINEIFGYECGDIILKVLAERVNKLNGIAARMSGGEILWIPELIKPRSHLEITKAALEQAIEYQNINIPFTVTMGFINCDVQVNSAEDLYKRLNTVLDEACSQQKGLLQYDDTVEQKYKRRYSIITNLKKALFEDADELALVYQPKINLQSNTVTQAEALIRWNNAELGFVAPDEFISIAEQAGFIGLVTRWVLRRAVRDVMLFKSEGLHLNIAVNISPEDLLDDTFIPYVTHLLEDNLVDHRALSFEITESIIVEQPEEAIKRIQQLKDVGFKLAIDDFGTGYSSLAYLTQLPVDLIKIDRSFVQKLSSNEQDQAICQTVIDLANKFDLEVVAEGVEDENSMNLLRDWGCHWGQGYYINRPVKFREFLEWHARHSNKNTLA